MKMAYSICSVLVLTVVGLVFLGSGTSFAGHDCPCFIGGNACGWLSQPTATDADSGGNFNTATDGDSNEPTIQWCLENHPIGAGVFFVEPSSLNIASVTYSPSSFEAHCSGSQEIAMSGTLGEPEDDGTLVTKAAIGPGVCQANKSLAINAD